jgi:thioredoxin-like negative regulator of GroEL
MAENIILFFSNEVCSVCEPLFDKLEKLVMEDFPRLDFKKISIVENPDLRAKYNVYSSPLIILILEGKEFLRFGGNTSIYEIKQKVERLYALKFEE